MKFYMYNNYVNRETEQNLIIKSFNLTEKAKDANIATKLKKLSSNHGFQSVLKKG